jgi:annexin A7/11
MNKYSYYTNIQTIIEIIASKTSDDLLLILQAYKASFGEDLLSRLKSELAGDFKMVILNMFTPLPSLDAIVVHDAVTGFGTDEELLVEALSFKSNLQLVAMKQAYQTLYQKDLEKEVIRDTSGDLQRFFVALIAGSRDQTGTSSNVDADVDALYAAGQGRWGTKESVFISMLASKSYGHLAAVSQKYSAKHGQTIANVIKEEFSGTLQKVLVAFVEAAEDYPTFLANRLEKTMARLGTNDRKLSSLVLRIKESDMLERVKEAYFKKYGRTLRVRVGGETGPQSNYQRVLLTLIN